MQLCQLNGILLASTMNGEPGEANTPVRRSSRARKPNSRFADDELDGRFKKIVTGLSSPETPIPLGSPSGRPRKVGRRKDSRSSEDGSEVRSEEPDDDKSDGSKLVASANRSQTDQKDMKTSDVAFDSKELHEKCETRVSFVEPSAESEALVNGLEGESENEKNFC